MQITDNQETIVLENLRYLSDTHKNMIHLRYNHVWSIFISLVTLYLVCIGASIQLKIQIPHWFVWTLFSGLGASGRLLFVNVYRANEKNQKSYMEADNMIIKLSGIHEYVGEQSSLNEKYQTRNKASFARLIITVIQCFIIIVLTIASITIIITQQ